MKKVFRSKKIIIGIFLLLAIIGFFFLRSRRQSAHTYEIIAFEKRTVTKTLNASGQVKAEKHAELAFQSSGLLNWLGVQEGDQVKKYQALASLDQRSIKKNLQKYLNLYSKERWDFDQSREDYDIHTQDFSDGHISTEVRRILEKNQWDLDNTVIDVELQDLSRQLSTITAPFAGLIVKVDPAHTNINLTAATKLVELVDPETIYFSALIDEEDIGRVSLHQEVQLELDAYPGESIDSQIEFISFDSTTDSSGNTVYEIKVPLTPSVISSVVEGSLSLSENSYKYRLGMNGDAVIFTQTKTDVLAVPFEAIKERGGFFYVQIIKPGQTQPEEIEIKIGLEGDEYFEVLSGINPDDQIIIGSDENKSSISHRPGRGI